MCNRKCDRMGLQARLEDRHIMISDRQLDEYYARDYYGPGTNYFEPPETEDDLNEWEKYEDDL